jgi:putative hydrolase of HD superfamily
MIGHMKQRELLDFLSAIECLKTNGRHCVTRGGATETVAAHSWRLAVMALLLLPEFPEIDGDKLIRMCLVPRFRRGDYGRYPVVSENEGTRID